MHQVAGKGEEAAAELGDGDTERKQDDGHAQAFAEFPIVGGQIHDQLGVESFSGTLPSLIIGVAGALIGGRGFAHAMQNTMNKVWAVPKVARPGFFPRYLRTISLLLLLSLIVVVTGAASTAAGTAASLGLGGLGARFASLAVGTALGFAFFLILFRVAVAGEVSTRDMWVGAAISALGWQILLTIAGIVVSHQLRHAQAVAGLFGVVLGLLAWLALQATVIVYAIQADVVRVSFACDGSGPEASRNRRSPGRTSPTTAWRWPLKRSGPNNASNSTTKLKTLPITLLDCRGGLRASAPMSLKVTGIVC